MIIAESLQNYRIWKKNTLLVIALFFIYPLGAVPFIIKGLLKNERWAFFLWAFFMGLLGILYPPTGDLYRYTQDYYTIRSGSWDDFRFFLTIKQDWLLSCISYILGRLELNFDLSRFIYNFFSYYLLGCLYQSITKSNLNYSKKNALLFLGTFMIFSIGAYTIRFSASSVLFAYGAYRVVHKGKSSGWLFVILSVINHLSFIVFAVIMLFYKCRFFAFSRRIVIIMMVLSFTVDTSFFVKLLSFMPIDIINHYTMYIDGYWAEEFLNDHSLKYRIQMLATSLISYAAAVIYILTYNKNNKTITIVNCVLLLTTLVAPFATIATRFAGVLLLFIKIHFLSIYKNIPKYRRYLVIMFYLSLLSNLMGVWESRRQLSVSDIRIVAYSSVPQILSHTYSVSWINSNVYDNGDFKHD